MYNLSHFKEQDQQAILDFMKAHPFALLIANGTSWPVATQVPLLIEERNGQWLLSGHMMRKQDHTTALENDPHVLVVFTGPHAYVSASWYTNQQQASTWNYQSVHVKGNIRFVDQDMLEIQLQKLSSLFEKDPAGSPTVFQNLPADYKDPLLKAIVGFEIQVEQIDHVFKLSQNRDQESFQHIIHKLQEQGGEAAAVALEMEKYRERRGNENAG